MNIVQNLLDISPYNRPGTKLGTVKAVACHYVGNPGSSAVNNRNYFNNLAATHATKASSHYIIGLSGEIIQCIPEAEISYCTSQANSYTISIEACHPDASGRFNDDTRRSYAELCADICKRRGLDPLNGGLIRHYDVTGKVCPKWFVDHPGEWEQFKRDVKSAMSGLTPAASAPAAPVVTPPVTAPASAANPLLISGSKGDSVKTLQNKLISLGYSVGSTGADGIFGNGTLSAVKAFQTANGLAADGKAGDKTWAKLDGNQVKYTALKATNPYKEPTANIRQGSKGDGVKWVQWNLKNKGYDIGSAGIDGDCGKSTAAAIIKFQRDKGLSADGICGANTREKLRG